MVGGAVGKGMECPEVRGPLTKSLSKTTSVPFYPPPTEVARIPLVVGWSGEQPDWLHGIASPQYYGGFYLQAQEDAPCIYSMFEKLNFSSLYLNSGMELKKNNHIGREITPWGFR